jgi:hypothetical protein
MAGARSSSVLGHVSHLGKGQIRCCSCNWTLAGVLVTAWALCRPIRLKRKIDTMNHCDTILECNNFGYVSFRRCSIRLGADLYSSKWVPSWLYNKRPPPGHVSDGYRVRGLDRRSPSTVSSWSSRRHLTADLFIQRLT